MPFRTIEEKIYQASYESYTVVGPMLMKTDYQRQVTKMGLSDQLIDHAQTSNKSDGGDCKSAPIQSSVRLSNLQQPSRPQS